MTTRIIRRIRDRKAQDAETYRYWQSRTTSERMQAVAELTRDGYASKGIDVDAQGSKELLFAFNKHKVEYLVIGGHAVSEHSQPRATKHLDIFIRADSKNSEAVYRALADYGAPLSDVTPADFNNQPYAIFQIGIEPNRVDILLSFF